LDAVLRRWACLGRRCGPRVSDPRARLPRFPSVIPPAVARRAARAGLAALLQLDAAAGLFEIGLQLVGLFLLDALLDGLGRLVDGGLRLLEAEASRRAHDLDHLDLLVARAGEDDVERRLLLGCLAGAIASDRPSGRGSRGDRGRRDAELLLERLDP